MGDLAIRLESLSKLYRIGPRLRYRTLRDSSVVGRLAVLRRRSAVVRRRSSRRPRSSVIVGTGFHPELTGRENIYLNGAMLGMKKAELERKFDEIVAFAEVEKFINTPVKHYSSGMYMRLAFAVAAHLEPEILLVDESLS
jgi:lipopolysaccharide transport system ATP-binding protein